MLDEVGDEVIRLRAEIIAKDAKIRELEETVARCARLGIRLSEVLAEHDPAVERRLHDAVRNTIREHRR